METPGLLMLKKQAREAALSVGAPMIKKLAEMLAGDNIMAQDGAKQMLFDITARATSPDNLKHDKKTVISALEKEIEHNYSKTATTYLEWLLEMAKSVE